MKKFEDWQKVNEEIKKNFQQYHNHDIQNIRMDILSIIKVLRESENPYDKIQKTEWNSIKEKHKVFGSYIDRLIGSLGETEDLDNDRFFSLLVLAKQRKMDMNLEEMSKDIRETYKKLTLLNG